MRASLKENCDVAKRCRVWLDSIEVTHDCFEADEEQGYVLLYKRDETGHLFHDPSGNGAAWERKDGIVRIEVKAEEEMRSM